MWPYWLMFLFPAALAFQEASKSYRRQVTQPSSSSDMSALWWFVFIVYAALIGWRHEVGGDWSNFIGNFLDAAVSSRYLDWWMNDPGYRFFEWASTKMGWDIYGVNIMSALIFMYGLVVFCLHLPRPWLGLTVSVPYLIIILGMGYSRQGIALGCVMAGLVAMGQGNARKFVFWVIFGALFHKSAILLLPIAALASSKNRWFTALWVGAVLVVGYLLLLEDSVEYFRFGYLEQQYQSEGALIRLVMNLLPALLLLWKRKRFAVTVPQQRLWFWLAIGAVVMFALYYISPSSTAVDRVGLYLLPLQLMVFSYLPEVMGRKDGRGNFYWVLSVIFYYAAVEFVWLHYANHSAYWIPYKWYPFELI